MKMNGYKPDQKVLEAIKKYLEFQRKLFQQINLDNHFLSFSNKTRMSYPNGEKIDYELFFNDDSKSLVKEFGEKLIIYEAAKTLEAELLSKWEITLKEIKHPDFSHFCFEVDHYGVVIEVWSDSGVYTKNDLEESKINELLLNACAILEEFIKNNLKQ